MPPAPPQLTLAFLLFGTGAGWSFLLLRRAQRPVDRLVWMALTSLLVDLVVGLAVARLHRFERDTLAAALAAAALAGFVVAFAAGVRPPRLPRRSALRIPWRPLAVRAGTIAVLAAPVATHVLRQWKQPWHESRVAWYYLADTIEIVQHGRIPDRIFDHGIWMPFEVNKIGWYIPVAEWIALCGTHAQPMFVMHQWVLAAVGLLTIGAYAVFRRLVPQRAVALFGTLLMCFAPRIIWKTGGFRGEGFGLAVFFLVLGAVLDAHRRGRIGDAIRTGLGLGLLATCHLVPAVVAVFWYAAEWLVGLRRRGLGRSLLGAGLAAAIAAGLAAAAFATASPGVAGEQSALFAPDSYRPYRGFDPTDAFVQLVSGKPLSRKVKPFVPAGERIFYQGPLDVAASLAKWLELPVPWWPSHRDKLLPFFYLLLAFGLARAPPRVRRPWITWAVFLGILYAWGLFFSAVYHTMLPALHPARREFPYAQTMLAVVFVPLVPWAFSRLAERWFGWRRAAVLALAWVLTAAGPARAAVKQLRRVKTLRPVARDAREVLAWLRRHTPPDALILTDGPTDGIVRVLARRRALLEGRAPYFQPKNLEHVLRTLQQASRYFRNPMDPDHVAWLRSADVDYVVTGAVRFGARPFPAPAFDRRRLPGHLERVGTFGRLRIYRVLPPEEARPDPLDPWRGQRDDVAEAGAGNPTTNAATGTDATQPAPHAGEGAAPLAASDPGGRPAAEAPPPPRAPTGRAPAAPFPPR